MHPKTALITGITGQDGSYLAELLLAEGYEVHGLVREVELADPGRWLTKIAPFQNRLTLHAGDLDNRPAVAACVRAARPSECYHLAAVSVVSYSPADEAVTLNSNIGGTHTLLSEIRETVPACRFFFAASSEIFGNATESPQSETTLIQPRSVYGVSKAAGLMLIRQYRQAHGMHASCGILYNHESPRRGVEFVTRKITAAAARIAGGSRDPLRLGNLEARRDWGHARDYVRAMWMMLRRQTPDDYVIATGVTHSVRDFCQAAFDRVGLRYEDWVESDPALFRPLEKTQLVGDSSKARQELGWTPGTRFEDLVGEMVDYDLRVAGVESRERKSA